MIFEKYFMYFEKMVHDFRNFLFIFEKCSKYFYNHDFLNSQHEREREILAKENSN
jgi:hypothetical protein